LKDRAQRSAEETREYQSSKGGERDTRDQMRGKERMEERGKVDVDLELSLALFIHFQTRKWPCDIIFLSAGK
jgi:hypothetical protein